MYFTPIFIDKENQVNNVSVTNGSALSHMTPVEVKQPCIGQRVIKGGHGFEHL